MMKTRMTTRKKTSQVRSNKTRVRVVVVVMEEEVGIVVVVVVVSW